MKTEIKTLLTEKLPNTFNIIVEEQAGAFGGRYLKIAFSPNTHLINDVRGQFPQVVSLCLDLNSLELDTQVYGGSGGGSITRNINPNNENEKYLAMKSVKVPFRRPKAEEKFVLNAISKFVDSYMKTLKENFELLRYKDVVDYSFLNC